MIEEGEREDGDGRRAMRDIIPEGKLLMPCQILVSHIPFEPKTFPHLN